MNFKKLLPSAALCLSMFLFAGCALVQSAGESGSSGTKNSSAAAEITEIADESEMFTNRDLDASYDETESVSIFLSDEKIACASSSVKISGSTVTLTEEGVYVISGSLTDGQIIVDAEKTVKIQIVLSGVSVTSGSSAALYVRQADKVFVTLKEGTENSLKSSGEYVAIDENNIDAAIFSKEDITLNGSGALTVASAYGHGIVSKDDLTITDGSYTVTALKHALCGKDCVKIAGGTFLLTAEKDAIHSENADDASLGYAYVSGGKFTLNADSDGIDSACTLQIKDGEFTVKCGGKGIKSSGSMIIAGGAFDISSTDDSVHSNASITIADGVFTCATSDDGFHADDTLTVCGGEITVTESYEGLEAETLVVSGGTINITASDDGMNAAGGNDSSGFGGNFGDRFASGGSSGTLKISGGVIYIDAGGDGVDSNGDIYVSGGEIYVSGSTNTVDAALDYDGSAQITGGIFVAAGSSGMAQNFGSSSTQGSILVNYSSRSNSQIELRDADGNVLATYAPPKSYNSVVISCPYLTKGVTVSLSAGGSTNSITLTSLIYGGSSSSIGGGASPGGPFGR